MPSWCENELILIANATQILDIVSKCVGRTPFTKNVEKFCFNQFVPIPEALAQGDYYQAAHQWELDNWGVQWGPADVKAIPTSLGLAFSFKTATNPPILFFDKFSEMYVHCSMTLLWCNVEKKRAGHRKYDRGTVLDNFASTDEASFFRWMEIYRPTVIDNEPGSEKEI